MNELLNKLKKIKFYDSNRLGKKRSRTCMQKREP